MLRNTAIALAAGSLLATVATLISALSSSSACVPGAFPATYPIARADLLAQQKCRAGIDSGAAHRRAAVQKTSNDLAGFADVVDAVKPAVIGVRAGATQQPRGSRKRNLPDSPFEPPPPAQRGPRGVPAIPGLPQELPQTTQGSGFFITANGYAVTNRNVVENDKTVEIKTDDQKTYPAKVIGTDSVSGLALLKVEGRNDFPHVKLADNPPRVGDWILAVGNPFGLGGTVTRGIVSARERNLGTSANDDLIQIDAPINQGDSGGPTFDLDGNVIGVNMTIVSPTGGSVGIAFATPADTVRMVVDQLREKGTVTRAWLGIQIQPVTAEIADNLGFKGTKGAVVAQPQPNSPAAKAGLKSGDIITSLNGDAVENPRTLSKKIAVAAPGAPVKLVVFRQGNEETMQVTLGELPSEDPAAGK
jgi:serine protease Do